MHLLIVHFNVFNAEINLIINTLHHIANHTKSCNMHYNAGYHYKHIHWTHFYGNYASRSSASEYSVHNSAMAVI